MLVGACDALSTPRTLGPLRDLTPFVGPQLSEALREGDREQIFAALQEELSSMPGTVLVVEDVHWSDEATLDVLRFLARRIDSLHAVLVLTYRDEELDRGLPLPRLLGDLPGNVRRLALQRLSMTAVRVLTAHSGLDPDRVSSLTGGNPYFVSELVASADTAQCLPPWSIRYGHVSAVSTPQCGRTSSSSRSCPRPSLSTSSLASCRAGRAS